MKWKIFSSPKRLAKFLYKQRQFRNASSIFRLFSQIYFHDSSLVFNNCVFQVLGQMVIALLNLSFQFLVYNFKALFGSCRKKKKKKTILNVNLAKIFLETVMDLNQWSSYSTKFLTLRVCLDRTYFAETENWKLKTL